MKLELLASVVLCRDMPEEGLRAGDLGTVVEVYEPDGLAVEFLTADGGTQAVATLQVDDVRAPGCTDVVSVRTSTYTRNGTLAAFPDLRESLDATAGTSLPP